MVQKSQLLELVDAGYEEAMYFAGMVSPEERSAVGKADHWLAKDILAHIGEWQLRSIAELEGVERTDPDLSGLKGNEDAENAVVFEHYRIAAWEEVLSLVRTAYEKVRRVIGAATEEELNQVSRQDEKNRSMWREIASDVYVHPMEHLNPEYVRRGHREHALKSQEAQGRLVLALDDSEEWQSIGMYNQGCGWALLGEKQKALDLVEKALRLAPHLIEWSKQDADLASLHGTPEFEAMLARVGKAE